jgi:hypothetical protein
MNATWAQGFATGRSTLNNQFGIEQASPLYTREIVEYILSVPEERISRPGHARFLQSNAMRKVLPDIVCNRSDKTTFSPLLTHGLRREKAFLKRLLQQPLIVLNGWVEGPWLEQQFASAPDNENAQYALSNCLHLEMWLQATQRALSKEKRWSEPEPPLS